MKEKKEKQVNPVHLKMSEHRQNSVSGDMDKEAEDMDDNSSTPPFSMNSVTTEDLADLDELMHCDDVLEDQEVTGLRTHSVISDESGMTYRSPWGSSPDSDISDMITPFDQNIDEEIKQVCQNFFNLENPETEADDFGENEDVRITDTGSTSSLAIKSNESTVPASCPSSSSSNTAITKADKMLLQSTEAVKIQTDNYLDDSKEVMMEGGSKGKRKKSQWKRCFSGRRRNRVQPAPLEHLNDLSSGSQQGSLCSEEMPSTSCSAALGADLRSTQLQRVDYTEDEDQTPEDTRNVLSSLSSASSIPPDYRVVEITWAKSPEDPPLTESTTDEFQKEMSSSLSQQSTDSGEEDEEPFSQSSVEQSQSDIDKEAEDMDDISSTPPFSMNSATTEDLANLDELMHCDDVLEDQEVTGLRTHSVISDESGITYPSSWCSSPDSDISNMITPFDPNNDGQIKQLCQNFCNLENPETGAEDYGAKVEVRTTDSGSTSCLAIRSNKSTVPASCSSSSSSNTAITKADKMLISQMINETVKTPQSTEAVKTTQSTEAVETPQSTEAAKTPQSTEAAKTPQSTEAIKTPQSTEAAETLQSTEAAETPQSTEAAETPQSTEAIKTPQSTEAAKTPQSTEAAKTQQSTEAIKTPRSTEAAKTPQSTEAANKPQSTEAAKTPQALQASLDRGSSSITVADRCLASKDRAAKKTLKRAIKTMKSFLPGRSTALKRIQTGGRKGKSKKSQWKWCFSRRRRNRIQPAPLQHLDETVRSASTNLTPISTGERALCSPETPSTTSCIAALGADLRSTKLVLVDYVEDEDQTPEDTRNVLSSLSSASSITPDYQVKVAWSKRPENPPLTESTTDESQEDITSLSQQSTDSDEENEEPFSQSSVEQSQSDSEYLSNNQRDAEETKAKRSNHFSHFICKIFSKNKQEEKEKKVSAENQTKQPPFWLWLLFCSACSCCLDK